MSENDGTEPRKQISETADITCEFLEVIIHSILYIRKLYPHQIFKKAKKYGVVTYQSIHPCVNEYIAKCLKAIHFHLKSNYLKAVYICVLTRNEIVERYVFDIVHSKGTSTEDLYIDLEQSFHDFCLKLHAASNFLDKLLSESTFIIQLYISEYNSMEFAENVSYQDFPWILINLKNWHDAEIIPIHSINTNILKVQAYIEKIKMNALALESIK